MVWLRCSAVKWRWCGCTSSLGLNVDVLFCLNFGTGSCHKGVVPVIPYWSKFPAACWSQVSCMSLVLVSSHLNLLVCIYLYWTFIVWFLLFIQNSIKLYHEEYWKSLFQSSKSFWSYINPSHIILPFWYLTLYFYSLTDVFREQTKQLCNTNWTEVSTYVISS